MVAIMKDHSKARAKFEKDYPKLPVRRIKFRFTEKDFEEIEQWLHERFAEIAEAEKLPDDELPLCTQKKGLMTATSLQ